MIPAPRTLSVPPGTRMNVEVVFDGAADPARIAAVRDALASWATGGRLTLPDGARVLSALPAVDAFAAPAHNPGARVLKLDAP